jgi:polar amino acid transport system substrate-binding protein
MPNASFFRSRFVAGAFLACVAAAPAVQAQESDHPGDKPLVVGSDFGVAPWIVRGASGPEGFGVDLINEIGKRLQRPAVEIVDVNFSALFASLFSKRIEFTVNPLNITAERAERMIFTQPIMSTGNGFLVKASSEMKSFEDLKGKAIAVNRGTLSDTWATANSATYGFEVQRYDTFPDTVQAVLTNRAFAAINEVPTTIYAASRNKAIKVAYKDFSSSRNFGYAFRPESVAYRNKVDDILKCLKTDGTISRLHQKWYGSDPEKGSALVTVYPGYGAPGFKGYVDSAPAPVCK